MCVVFKINLARRHALTLARAHVHMCMCACVGVLKNIYIMFAINIYKFTERKTKWYRRTGERVSDVSMIAGPFRRREESFV